MTRLLVGAAAVTATLTFLVVITCWMGSLSGSPEAIAMLAPGPSCSQPCWQGIQPGRTTLVQVAVAFTTPGKRTTDSARLLYANELCWDTRTVPPWHGCARRQWEVNPGTPLNSLELEPPAGALRLGDAIAVLGEPAGSRTCPVDPNTDPTLVAIIYFKPGIVIVAKSTPEAGAILSPAMLVRRLLYYAPTQEFLRDVPAWRGFRVPLKTRILCGVY